MSFILTTAATHFVLAAQVSPDVAKDSRNRQAISKSSKWLFDKVTMAHKNRELQPIRRSYVMSTDDTTEFVFHGQGTKVLLMEFPNFDQACKIGTGAPASLVIRFTYGYFIDNVYRHL